MTVKELYDILGKFVDNIGDQDVVISTDNFSIGPSSCSYVHAVGEGFDWDKGKFFIFAKDKLIKEERIRGNNDG